MWRRPFNKRYKEQLWFKLWILESYSIRRLCVLSGHSRSKLQRIKNYWLSRLPQETFDYGEYKYLLFDGTYFHKQGCLIILMDALTQKVIFNAYIDKEGYYSVLPFLLRLKKQGLRPWAIAIDGHQKVLMAIREVWPETTIQRCLYHIQREGLRWLRTFPKTQAGKDLRTILGNLHRIKSGLDRDLFWQIYRNWLKTYKTLVRSLPSSSVAFKDLKRTMALINHAIPNMFHYLKDSRVPATTNILESFYSRLKSDFRRHRGLSESHKRAYLHWYCYFKNQQITNT